jgi:hypothetical protein
VEQFGREYGSALTEAAVDFVKDWRTQGLVPTAPDGTVAPLAEAIFKLSDDDLVARTYIGAMMGFLPTVDANVRLSLNEWLKDGTFWSLRAAMAADSVLTFAKAETLLMPPLIRAMQLRPSPELVWRTAMHHHQLGKNTPGASTVQVEPDDKVVLSIVSATQQCLEKGEQDLLPMFGGKSCPRASSPTHACPGYKAAMGAILGVLSALLECKESMRPTPVPLAFIFDGPIPEGIIPAHATALF